MASVTACTAAVPAVRPSLVQTRRTSLRASGARVARFQTVCSAAKKPVVASPAKKQALALPAALVVSAGAMLAHPVAAEAAVTPSLKNLLSSLVAGGAVFGAIVFALSTVASFDPVNRGRR